jgi:hypothetical protein
MLSESGKNKDYVRATNSKGEPFAAESLFMGLIFQQQKMISHLIAQLSEYKRQK